MTKRTIYFLKLWLVALTGLVSVDSLAQTNYELVIEMRDGSKQFALIKDGYPKLSIENTQDPDTGKNRLVLAVYLSDTPGDRFYVLRDKIKRLYTQEATSTIILGDANGNGVVEKLDVVEIVNYIIGKTSDKFNFVAADVNKDGVVNATDIVKVISIIESAVIGNNQNQ